MKKQTGLISFLTVLCFLLVIWLPCQAADDLIYVCKNIKTGTPRFVSSPNKCKTKTEYPVTLNGTAQQNPVPNFEGDICWIAQKTEDEQGPSTEQPRIVRSRINYINGTYIYNTIMEVAGYDPLISNGTAQVIGDKIIATATESFDYSPWRITGINRSVIDKNTLNGTGWLIRNSFNTSTRAYDSEYIFSTLTLTTCP